MMTITELVARCEVALLRGWAADRDTGMKASHDDAARWVHDELRLLDGDAVGDLGGALYALDEAGEDLHAHALVCAGYLVGTGAVVVS